MSNPIYDQYIAYYNGCNTCISAIDNLPYDERNKPNVVSDRATIVAQQALLYPIYQRDYQSTLDQFIADCSGVENAVNAAYIDAVGGGSIQQQIQAAYTNGQNTTSQISGTIAKDLTSLGSVPTLQNTIVSLQAQIDALPAGPQKTKAQTDLTAAQALLATLIQDIASAQAPMAQMQSELNTLTSTILPQLQALAAKSNPTQDDLTTADLLLKDIQTVQNDLQVFQNGAMAAVSKDLLSVQNGLQAVKNDIQPAPTPGAIEHGCWYIDWTSWTFPIPQGVNTVNIFVGQLTNTGGVPAIGGFGNMNPTQLQAFVEQCHNQVPPIAVKVSIGGGGGSYDNCWDVLTADNINSFAQMLATFCHDNKLNGVDFDYEEFKGTDQEALVGTLIRQFKALDPTLQATLCTNAGFGSQYPWGAVVQTILDASKDPVSGKCPVDRLYIMSYYNPMPDEQGWLLGWADWLKTRYGFSPSQVTVGLDDTDAHAYDIGEFSAWAGSQGFSTGYWAWNPSTQASSDQSALKILSSYTPSILKRIKYAVFRALRPISAPVYSACKFVYSLFAKKPAMNPRLQNREAMTERWRLMNSTYRPLPSAPPADDLGQPLLGHGLVGQPIRF